MEWLILVLVTPVIIVLVVLLYGFVGCTGDDPMYTPTPPTLKNPTKLKVEGFDTNRTNRIDFSWDDSNSAIAIKGFNLERRSIPPFGSVKIEKIFIPKNPGDPRESSDVVGEGAAFQYAVTAVAHDDTESDPSNVIAAETLLEKPAGFKATAVGPKEIHLDWTNPSMKATNIRLDRPHVIGAQLLLGSNITSFEDKDLTPGTKYSYTLTALNLDNGTASEPVYASATTLVWKTSFETPINLDGGDYYAGSCLVQIIKKYAAGDPATLQESGTMPKGWVRITMFSDGDRETKITAVYISRVGVKPHDSANDITQVLFPDLLFPNGAPGVTLSKAIGPQLSKETKYTLDRDQDLLIAFDTAIDSGNIYYGQPQGPQLWAKRPQVPGVAFPQAATAIRDADYVGPEDNRVNCVQKIEVA